MMSSQCSTSVLRRLERVVEVLPADVHPFGEELELGRREPTRMCSTGCEHGEEAPGGVRTGGRQRRLHGAAVLEEQIAIADEMRGLDGRCGSREIELRRR